jgi:hypothetical protein
VFLGAGTVFLQCGAEERKEQYHERPSEQGKGFVKPQEAQSGPSEEGGIVFDPENTVPAWVGKGRQDVLAREAGSVQDETPRRFLQNAGRSFQTQAYERVGCLATVQHRQKGNPTQEGQSVVVHCLGSRFVFV